MKGIISKAISKIEDDRIACTDLTFKMPSTYKKEKPWDTNDIDKWKVSLVSVLAGLILDSASFLTGRTTD